MTISAQQPQVPLVCFPIFESPRPSILPIFGPYLLGRINVVNVERSVIRKSALNTLAAKFLNYFEFSFPVARVLVNRVTVFVPVILNAINRTKSIFAIGSAMLAFSVFAPSRRKITGLIAKFSSAIFDAIGMGLKNGFATGAFNVNFCAFSHAFDYITVYRRAEPKYFDIACERIENAQRQQKLFEN